MRDRKPNYTCCFGVNVWCSCYCIYLFLLYFAYVFSSVASIRKVIYKLILTMMYLITAHGYVTICNIFSQIRPSALIRAPLHSFCKKKTSVNYITCAIIRSNTVFLLQSHKFLAIISKSSTKFQVYTCTSFCKWIPNIEKIC